MTGAEHYQRAEALLESPVPDDLAEAQVHATLAVAAFLLVVNGVECPGVTS